MVVSVLAISAVVFAVPARAATIGTLQQLASPGGCTTDTSTPVAGCATARGLDGVAPFFGSHAVALSPDGKNLYAASFDSEAITIFNRSSSSGRLTQKSDTAGCASVTTQPSCAQGRSLIKPTSIAVSPDGRSVYVASIVGSSIAVFDRNTSTGALTQKSGTAGCVAKDGAHQCATGRAMEGVDVVAVSPDNKHVYAGGFTNDSLVVFDRNRSTGSIKQKSGTSGCFVETAQSDCTTARGLNGAEGLTISPDGISVYVGAAVGNAVAVFRRNRSNGTLSQSAGTTGCFAFQAASGCSEGHGLVGADSMQVSSDNKNLYVASGVGDSIAAFKRSTSSGNLTQLAGIGACYTNFTQTLGRCASGVQLDGPEGILVSPDGRNVYVGSFFSNAIAVFDRVPYTGTLTQRVSPNGCVVEPATSGCATGTALQGANALEMSNDGRRLYVGANGSNAIDVFSRAAPPSGWVRASVPNRVKVAIGRSVSLPIACTGSKNRRCPGGIAVTSSGRGGSFNIPTGQRRNVTVLLSADQLSELRSNGSVEVIATMRVVDPSGEIKVTRTRVLLIARAVGFAGSNPKEGIDR